MNVFNIRKFCHHKFAYQRANTTIIIYFHIHIHNSHVYFNTRCSFISFIHSMNENSNSILSMHIRPFISFSSFIFYLHVEYDLYDRCIFILNRVMHSIYYTIILPKNSYMHHLFRLWPNQALTVLG